MWDIFPNKHMLNCWWLIHLASNPFSSSYYLYLKVYILTPLTSKSLTATHWKMHINLNESTYYFTSFYNMRCLSHQNAKMIVHRNIFKEVTDLSIHVSPVHIYLTSIIVNYLAYLINTFFINSMSWRVRYLKVKFNSYIKRNCTNKHSQMS